MSMSAKRIEIFTNSLLQDTLFPSKLLLQGLLFLRNSILKWLRLLIYGSTSVYSIIKRQTSKITSILLLEPKLTKKRLNTLSSFQNAILTSCGGGHKAHVATLEKWVSNAWSYRNLPVYTPWKKSNWADFEKRKFYNISALWSNFVKLTIAIWKKAH